MKFFWTKTGDSLDVEVSNTELAEHWFNHLPSKTFIPKNDRFPYASVERIRDGIETINNTLKQKLDIDVFDYKEFKLDQRFLNKVHRDWAQVQQDNPNLTRLLYMMDSDLLRKFYDINDQFHDIEDECTIQYVDESSDKQFKHQMPGLGDHERFLTHGRNQLALEYWSIGRSDYDAWHQADDIAFVDNFQMLPFSMDVTLIKPFDRPYPQEYVKWMEHQGKRPVGSHLPLGNFKDYKDGVADLYDIFFRNNQIEQKVGLSL